MTIATLSRRPAAAALGAVFVFALAAGTQAANLIVDGVTDFTGADAASYDNIYVGETVASTLNIKDAASLTAVSNVDNDNTHPILVGDHALGAVDISGGTLTAVNGETWIGWWTAGVMNIFGGTANLKRVVIYNGSLNISTGTLTSAQGDLQIDWDNIPSLLAISGGAVNLRGVRMGNTRGTLALTGGVLTLGNGGIYGTGSGTIDLGGGTVRASASWSSSLPMNLTGAGGDVTFDPYGNTITLSGDLSGPGGLIIDATGESGALVLSGTNSTYGGNTTIHSGVLDVAAQPVYTMAAAGTHTFGIKPAGVGRINAAGLDIAGAKVAFTVTGAASAAVYILADYGSLTGGRFASVTGLPAGYAIFYAFNGGKQVALARAAGAAVMVR